MRPVYLVLVLLVITRCFWAIYAQPKYEIGQVIRITGRLTKPPKISSRSAYLLLDRFIVSGDVVGDLKRGDRVTITARVEQRFPGIEAKYLVKAFDIKINAENKNDNFVLFVYRLTDYIGQMFSQGLPSPEAELASGMVLGQAQDLPITITEKFRREGLTHIVVASGGNVAYILALALGILTPISGRKLAMGFSLVFIWAFAIACGFDAPVVRAVVMASIITVSSIIGRESETLGVLLITSLLMIAFQPFLLISVSFWLSVAATLGVIMAGKLSWADRLGIFRETLFAQAFTLPVIITAFGWGVTSWVAPIANVSILWLVPVVSWLGIAYIVVTGVIGVGLFSSLLAATLYVPLNILIRIVDFWSRW